MRTIALLGGSFSPVHIGHVMVASYLSQFVPGIDAVWLIPAAQNPLKSGSPYMFTDSQRLAMLRAAVDGYPRLDVCDIEFHMPRPSYTVDTLTRLAADFPDTRFMWAMGSDNWQSITRWRRWQEVVERFGVIVYPRPGYAVDTSSIPQGSLFVDAPQVELSSTFIRAALSEGRDMRAFLPAGVWPLLRSFVQG